MLKWFGALALLLLVGFITSCQKDEANATEVENFVEQSTFEIESRCGVGLAGCYELVFPVTLEFADGTTAEVFSNEEMRDAIRNWYLENRPIRPRPMNRPTIQMPFDLVNMDGEIITVESVAQLRELLAECPGIGIGPNPNGHRPRACFKPVFPFSIEFPDGEQVLVNTPRELRIAVRTWHVENPGVPGRPVFVFPLTVELRDGTTVVVNSAEELQAIKEDCMQG